MISPVTPRIQIGYRNSTTPYVSIGPRGNLTVIKSDEHKTPSPGLLDTNVYLLLPFHSRRQKDRDSVWNASTALNRENKQLQERQTRT